MGFSLALSFILDFGLIGTANPEVEGDSLLATVNKNRTSPNTYGYMFVMKYPLHYSWSLLQHALTGKIKLI